MWLLVEVSTEQRLWSSFPPSRQLADPSWEGSPRGGHLGPDHGAGSGQLWGHLQGWGRVLRRAGLPDPTCYGWRNKSAAQTAGALLRPPARGERRDHVCWAIPRPAQWPGATSSPGPSRLTELEKRAGPGPVGSGIRHLRQAEGLLNKSSLVPTSSLWGSSCICRDRACIGAGGRASVLLATRLPMSWTTRCDAPCSAGLAQWVERQVRIILTMCQRCGVTEM